jgi:hypothetical protein
MKVSVYKLNHGVYLADLGERQIKRGSIPDLAVVLGEVGVTFGDLLLGDWREGAELLRSSEQTELRAAMMVLPDNAPNTSSLDSPTPGGPPG